MLTVSQVARKANVAPNTVRNYARDFPDLFGEAASGLQGNRLFTEDDVAAICNLVALKNSGLPLAQAAARLRDHETPPIIDVAASPLQTTSTALQAPQMALQVQSMLVARLDALERQQTTLLRAATLWGALLGAVVALAGAAFVLWLLYLLA